MPVRPSQHVQIACIVQNRKDIYFPMTGKKERKKKANPDTLGAGIKTCLAVLLHK